MCAVPARQCSSVGYTDDGDRALLDRVIRVDHAGEYGANRIYAGQMAVLGRSSVGPIIQVSECTDIFYKLRLICLW